MRPLAVLAMALLSGSAHALDAPVQMQDVARGFYGAYATFHPSDGIPDDKARAKYAPFVSPALEQLLMQAASAEKAFAKANKNAPPIIEGDLFTSNFEGATSYSIGACKAESTHGQCAVSLTYDDSKQNPKNKPVVWTDTLYLAMTPSGWKVDDIGYGANWAFANKGRLNSTLRDAISNAGH